MNCWSVQINILFIIKNVVGIIVSLLCICASLFSPCSYANDYDGRGNCESLNKKVRYARDVYQSLKKEVRYSTVDDSSAEAKELSYRYDEAEYALESAQENYDMGGCSRGGSTEYKHRYDH